MEGPGAIIMHAMLSLHLDEKSTTAERKKFYVHLKDSGWIQLAKITTTWFSSYKSAALEERIIAEVKQDVSAAARYSGITTYDAVVNIGQSKPSLL